MRKPFEEWMVRRNLEYVQEEGLEAVVTRLRARGYPTVADAVEAEASLFYTHRETCKSGHSAEWSGSQNPKAPDTSWVCDECGAVILA